MRGRNHHVKCHEQLMTPLAKVTVFTAAVVCSWALVLAVGVLVLTSAGA